MLVIDTSLDERVDLSSGRGSRHRRVSGLSSQRLRSRPGSEPPRPRSAARLETRSGAKRAYVLNFVGYAIGALAMTLAQDLAAIIVFLGDDRWNWRGAAK